MVVLLPFTLTSLSFSLSLSQYCTHPSAAGNATIDEFDIPFQKCRRTDFKGITLTTNYSTIVRYSEKHRSLRLSGGLHFVVEGVKDGGILQVLDVRAATLELRLIVPVISANVRVNRAAGANLIVRNGSLQTRLQRILRVIHTNDIHCTFEPNRAKGSIGLPLLLGYVRAERARAAREGDWFLFLDAGDYSDKNYRCTPTSAVAAMEAMNLSRYDAMTIGNHFWDFGHAISYENLRVLQDIGIPLVCANAEDKNPNETITFPEYVVKEQDGLRIGIFGLTMPGTAKIAGPKSRHITLHQDIVGISKKIVHTLRSGQRCHVIILIAHLGSHRASTGDTLGLAENFDGIDLIVDGHSHHEIEGGAFIAHNDHETLIVQTGTLLRKIGTADLLIDVGARRVIGKRARLLGPKDLLGITPDPAAEAFVKRTMGADPINVVHTIRSPSLVQAANSIQNQTLDDDAIPVPSMSSDKNGQRRRLRSMVIFLTLFVAGFVAIVAIQFRRKTNEDEISLVRL
jgi:hypothetical protein